ncbi:hypothetical protein RFI_01898, partial [Reticulomyxa filosa]
KQEQGNAMNEVNDNNNKNVKKETKKTEVGGIDLQGYCANETCLASKAKLPVWVNIGFNNITFLSHRISFNCPDCKKATIASIVKAVFYASDDSIPVKANNYQSSYAIKSGLSYESKANKIKRNERLFILDGFDEIFDKYDKNNNNNNSDIFNMFELDQKT